MIFDNFRIIIPAWAGAGRGATGTTCGGHSSTTGRRARWRYHLSSPFCVGSLTCSQVFRFSWARSRRTSSSESTTASTSSTSAHLLTLALGRRYGVSIHFRRYQPLFNVPPSHQANRMLKTYKRVSRPLSRNSSLIFAI